MLRHDATGIISLEMAKRRRSVCCGISAPEQTPRNACRHFCLYSLSLSVMNIPGRSVKTCTAMCFSAISWFCRSAIWGMDPRRRRRKSDIFRTGLFDNARRAMVATSIVEVTRAAKPSSPTGETTEMINFSNLAFQKLFSIAEQTTTEGHTND